MRLSARNVLSLAGTIALVLLVFNLPLPSALRAPVAVGALVLTFAVWVAVAVTSMRRRAEDSRRRERAFALQVMAEVESAEPAAAEPAEGAVDLLGRAFDAHAGYLSSRVS